MKEWWQGLNNQERRLVLVGGIFVVIFLLYKLIWQPLNDSIDKTQNKLEKQQELLVWVTNETARYASASRSSGARKSGGSLSSIVNSTARQNNIQIARLQPQNQDVQVWVDDVAFNQLLSWLEQLSSRQELVVKSIDLSKGSAPGQVQVKRLQLGR